MLRIKKLEQQKILLKLELKMSVKISMLRCHYESVDLYNAPGGASEVDALKAGKKGYLVEIVPVAAIPLQPEAA